MTGGPEKNPILSVWLSQPDASGSRYSFIEFTSPQDASTAMQLDGMACTLQAGSYLRLVNA